MYLGRSEDVETTFVQRPESKESELPTRLGVVISKQQEQQRPCGRLTPRKSKLVSAAVVYGLPNPEK